MMPAVAVTNAGDCRLIEINVARKPTTIAAMPVATHCPNPAVPRPININSATPDAIPAVITDRSGA